MKIVIMVLGLLLMTTDAWALRCGRELVHKGDHKADVLYKCGEPDWTDERYVVRGNRLRHPYGALESSEFEEILIEEWIYNFGPRSFKQFLQFENGILKDIRKLDYGF